MRTCADTIDIRDVGDRMDAIIPGTDDRIAAISATDEELLCVRAYILF